MQGGGGEGECDAAEGREAGERHTTWVVKDAPEGDQRDPTPSVGTRLQHRYCTTYSRT